MDLSCFGQTNQGGRGVTDDNPASPSGKGSNNNNNNNNNGEGGGGGAFSSSSAAAAEDGGGIGVGGGVGGGGGGASSPSSSSFPPQLVYQSNNTAIYRLDDDRGIKVLVDPNPSEEQILQLVHEHNISKFLPPSVRKRHVLDVKGFKGDPALYFQWCRGKTLAEWLRKKSSWSSSSRRNSTTTTTSTPPDHHHHHYLSSSSSSSSSVVVVDLAMRLRAAIAIVETLRSFHEGGVVYNNLSPKNVVLDTTFLEGGESGGSSYYVATLIDLSEAVVYYNGDDDAAFRRAWGNDLKCLGSLLNELFRGDDDDGDVDGHNIGMPKEAQDHGGSSSDPRLRGSWKFPPPLPPPPLAGKATATTTYKTDGEEQKRDEEEAKEEPSTRKRGRQQGGGGGEGVGSGIGGIGGDGGSGGGLLPMYLGTLISSLLNSNNASNGAGGAGNNSPLSLQTTTTRYESAKDVLLDLRVAEKKTSVYLKPLILDDSLVCSRLRLPDEEDAFYGRRSELSMLLHALNSVTTAMGGQPMLVSVSGSPGTGKTLFVNQIEKPLREANGHLVRGKFEMRTMGQASSSSSDSVICSALDAFYAEAVLREQEQEEEEEDGNDDEGKKYDDNKQKQLWGIRSRIIERVGRAGCRVLTRAIPSLRTLLMEDRGYAVAAAVAEAENNNDTTTTAAAKGGARTHSDQKYLLCKLVAATADQSCPLAIFLDDLQWADETSLDVIRMLVTDPDIKYCLFVGTYRDNQPGPIKQLKKLLHGMQEQGTNLMSIKIGPIERDCVNTLLSEALCLPPRLCQSLSTVIHEKTGGIALYVVRLLKSINEDGLLWFNLSSRRWEYNSRVIESTVICEDVAEHISERMALLPHGMQSGLKLSACLGSRFDANTLEKGLPAKGVDLHQFLRSAVESGYLREISSGKYMWAHDQIQQAAYELIPEAKRESFHLLLGSRMFLRTTPGELEQMIFFIVGNMNIGVRLVRSQNQKLEIARLNLRAGEAAMASSSFNSAASYLMLGLTLLPDDSWGEDYDLAIRLYDSAAEVLFVTGSYSALASIIQIPLHRARSLEDKLNAYQILVRFLIASGQMREGISKGIYVLAQLGEVVPEQVDHDFYTQEVQLVKRSLTDIPEDDLLNLPLMTDERKLACLQFMSHILPPAYHVEPLLAPVLVFRMVRLSISFGVCNISAFAFGLYGAWLVSAINSDFAGGYSMGRIAISLMNRLDAKEFIPRVFTSVYAFINIWKEPFQAGLAKQLEGYDAGAISGDMEYAIGCLFQYSVCALNSCGEDLGMLEKSIKLYIRRAIQSNQALGTKSLVLLHDQVLTLMGSSESSTSIFLDTREDAIYVEALRKGDVSLCRYILHKRKFLAFFYGDMEAAAQSFEMGSEYPLGANGRLSHISLSVALDGLIAFFFARKHGEDKIRWRNIGESVIHLTRQWALNSDWNFNNKLYLLEAECFFFRNDEVQALEKYQQSIKAAQDHHFIHEEGLAFERAARFHLHYGRNGEALLCFRQAKKCYKNWGAQGLVNHIERMILKLT